MLLWLAACGGTDVYGGGTVSVVLDDAERSGMVLEWVIPGLDDEALALAGGEFQTTLEENGDRGALVQHQPDRIFLVARGAWLTETAPPPDGCVAPRKLYFELDVDTFAGQPADRDLFVYLRLFADPEAEVDAEGQGDASAVFFESAIPGGIDLVVSSDTAGAMTAPAPEWRWPADTCWDGVRPDLRVEWNLDPASRVRL